MTIVAISKRYKHLENLKRVVEINKEEIKKKKKKKKKSKEELWSKSDAVHWYHLCLIAEAYQ